MPQGVHAGLLGDASGPQGLTEDALHLADAEGAVRPLSGEQPALWTVATPIIAELFRQEGGQGHQAILVPLGTADVQEHPLAVDVGDVQGDDFGDAQSGTIGGGERRLVLRPRCRLKQQRHLLSA